ncbi:serine/threonine protein phosphatase [Sphingobium sufflavum]|uniref:metallophosphoesterase family protein n=1 Tax=Sphingobium sufflavum TaxID=1129547 RepID=UPI001F21BB6D|nr:metallophosphoesterase family protein [Sphingobium sufflavum]MCE7797617.1 serine/threonine protein phosphatase [Sphingobium sufflavum]
MFRQLRSVFGSGGEGSSTDASAASFAPSVGEGVRVYAIGDVHGRCDLLRRLLETIVTDSEARGPVDRLCLVMLGDLVDRGADSAGVVDIVMAMADRWPRMTCLMGNHEEMFLLALRGDPHGLSLFRRLGRETLLSYGVDAATIERGSDEALFQAMMTQVPVAHRDFLEELPNSLVIGDYLFVHAGIRPGVALESQDGRDLRWIRGEFLGSATRHSHMVVHGHSISEFVDEQPNRIGIDTGAYASDRLTAIGLQGTGRWYLST